MLTITELNDTLRQARRMMNEHGLQNWRVGFDNAVKRYGQTRFSDRTITISRKLTALNPWERTQNVILHEIAHALAGPTAGHGHEWKRVARSIGCSAERVENGVITPPLAWKATCPNCRRVSRKARRSQSPTACGTCCRAHNGGRFTERFELVWQRNR